MNLSCYLAMTLITGLAWWMVRVPNLMAYSVFVQVTALVALFVVVWVHNGGVYSSYSTAYFTIMLVLISVMPRNFKISSLVLFCSITLILSTFFNYSISPEAATSFWMNVDYLMNSVLIAICILFVKDDLESERITYDQYNEQIDRLTEQLFEKRKKLLHQRNKIQNTKNNLEKIVEENTAELREKNELLATYAYDNAHILRAPLSNILGLIEILENDTDESTKNSAVLKELKEQAHSLDALVKKVNVILK
ncbi:hypothetical protein [Reichenbachiella ulvae]|uniref:histidine kinase n=1 Tax=Reichenbachiella ulvae TaxID=2980104 RepID=A0ABT3CPR2_9BACT|nr:hypothetical protein [Reichenbachiella ulvae]MCV9385647.1 hypothetical protein [Reichenbachiella ulvae]